MLVGRLVTENAALIAPVGDGDVHQFGAVGRPKRISFALVWNASEEACSLVEDGRVAKIFVSADFEHGSPAILK